MDDNPTPTLVEIDDEPKRYQIVKHTEIPPQIFVGEDDVVVTLAIPFVFVQEVPPEVPGEK